MEAIVSVTARRSSADNENFLALRFALISLIGESFTADVVIVCIPTCLLLMVCITCCKAQIVNYYEN